LFHEHVLLWHNRHPRKLSIMLALLSSLLELSKILAVLVGLLWFSLVVCMRYPTRRTLRLRGVLIPLYYQVLQHKVPLLVVVLCCLVLSVARTRVAVRDQGRLSPDGIESVLRAPHQMPDVPVPAATTAQEVPSSPSVQGEERRRTTVPLAGEWMMVNTVWETDYAAYHQLQLGFRLVIQQAGETFDAQGEKLLENGRPIPVAARSPITVHGRLRDGVVIEATFQEAGHARTTTGHLHLTMPDRNHLLGTFLTTAARSKGTSQWRRID
jgi:hypothetical protein